MEGMISNSNLTVSAWDSEKLVGISRCMTDFHYACYLSDLAVSEQYQKMGIGKQLQILTQNSLGHVADYMDGHRKRESACCLL